MAELKEPKSAAHAVLVPRSLLNRFKGDPGLISRFIKGTFGPKLAKGTEGNPDQVVIRHFKSGEYLLVTRSVEDTWGYPKTHPHHGLEPENSRYLWGDRGDGVLFGFLKPDPFADLNPKTPADLIAASALPIDSLELAAHWTGEEALRGS